MKKLLITGASGMLGHTLCRIASEGWEVHGVGRRAFATSCGTHFHSCDATEEESFEGLFSAVKPDAVIHLAAASQPNYCEEHPAQAREINVTVAATVARLCKTAGIPCVFTSTDLVFDGESAPYTEESQASPIMAYGRLKLEAEMAMREAYAETTICRMPLMYGAPSPLGGGNFMTVIAEKLRAGQGITLFTDEFRSPLGTVSASHGLLMALEHPGATLHLGGLERLSRYEFGQRVANFFGLGPDLVSGNKQADANLPAPRPRDVSLDSSKANRLGFSPRTVEDELREAFL
ncbi:MAG: NAD(P)-dependent oxidoreductase [Verrucomicrobiota bacterium]